MHNNDLEACGMKFCSVWFHSEVKLLTRFWHLFGLSHFALFQCNFYRFLCGKVFNLHLFCVISMFVGGRCLYKRFKCLKNFNEFSMYLFRWRKGEGGCTNACIYMGTQSAFTTELLMDVYETWKRWSAHGPAHALRCFGHICSGMDPGLGKNRSLGDRGRVPIFKKLLLQTGKATATNRMHSNDLEACEMKCCCFWFHSEVKFLTR